MPTQQRVRAMKELHDLVATKRLEEVRGTSQSCGSVHPYPWPAGHGRPLPAC